MTRSHVDYDPKLKAMLAGHRSVAGFVPIAKDGQLSHFINNRLVSNVPVTADMSVSDFVVGLELLGYRLDLPEDSTSALRFTVAGPAEAVPSEWHERAFRIMEAMPPERDDEVADFLASRIKVFRKREIVKALVEWVDQGGNADTCGDTCAFVRNTVPDATDREIEATGEWIIDTLARDSKDEIARRHVEQGSRRAA